MVPGVRRYVESSRRCDRSRSVATLEGIPLAAEPPVSIAGVAPEPLYLKLVRDLPRGLGQSCDHDADSCVIAEERN